MTITEMYFKNVQASANAKSSSYMPEATSRTDSKSSDFRNYLDNAGVSSNSKEPKYTDTAQKQKVKADDKNVENVINNEKGKQKAEPSKAKTKTEPAKKDAAQEVDQGQKADPKKDDFTEKDFDAACKEIIEKLSAELNIPVENIQQILISLNIKPLELLDAGNLNNFIQKIVGAQSPKSMLTMPGIQDVFTKVNGVMDEFKDIAQSFINSLENEAMGRPKFIDSGVKDNQAVFASSEAIQEEFSTATVQIKQPTQTEVSNNPEATAKDAVAATQVTPVEGESGEALGANVNSGNSGSSNNPGSDEDTAMLQTQRVDAPKDGGAVSVSANVSSGVQFEKAMLKNESVRNIDTQEVINQIVDKLKVEVKADTTEIKLTLKPEHLGDVTLKILTHNGVVTAQFMAENQRIKEVIEAGFNQLKQSLAEQGVNISQLSVSVGQENAEKQMGQFMQGQEKSSARINQIINNSNNIEAEMAVTTAQTYIHGNEMYDISVDYKA